MGGIMLVTRTAAIAIVALVSIVVSLAASAAPLTVVQVAAPGVNCIFDASCRLTVTDTVDNLPPVPGYNGKAVLQSRTANAAATGVPGAGTTVYIYRVDLTGAAAASDQMCVSSVAVNFGAITKLPYSGAGKPKADVFVVTTGGLGTVGLKSADQTGSTVTFQFSAASFPAPGDPFPPVCAGQTSFFFGLASTKAPLATKAQVHMGIYGIKSVGARAPAP
jgi:hypothetical protein